MSKVEKFLQSAFFRTLISIVVGFAVGAVFLAAVQINVGAAYGKLFTSIFANAKSLSYSVVYATPLIILGLSVAFSFRTGVFNIGAEGQFVVGSMAACVVGILVPAPAIVLVPLCVLVSAVAGAVWGMIVGILKVKWGINEVLSMIMFNWIAFYLSNYIAGLPAIKSDGNAEATKNVQEAAMILLPKSVISKLGLCNSANWGIFVAILLSIFCYVVIEKTTLGFSLKAVGSNRDAAEYAGINVNRAVLTALGISGAMGGIAGAMNLLGMGQRISIFTAQEGYGFQGIIAALIGNSNPLGVFFGGLFYGAIKYGGSRLNLIGAPSEVVNVIMGTVVFFIAISHIFKFRKHKKEGK
ncbi:MAG: ABC transporter permease [Subdoligranulum sp.]|nr:ABC transporter permease [Subdoligranulum sp.]MDD7264743.1 ABC transporter permease [Subdoligranulum sp.]MDY5922948.1 ABC transporter permease [Oscillospiraceae bacterium]